MTNAADMRDEFELLCGRYGVAAMWAFGSRAAAAAAQMRAGRGAAAAPGADAGTPAGSDLDIGLRLAGGGRLDERDRVRLAAALEDLFGAPRVDLVLLSEAAAFLAVEIINGELLVDRDPDGTAEHELYVLRRAGDLLPFERARRELVLRGGGR